MVDENEGIFVGNNLEKKHVENRNKTEFGLVKGRLAGKSLSCALAVSCFFPVCFQEMTVFSCCTVCPLV